MVLSHLAIELQVPVLLAVSPVGLNVFLLMNLVLLSHLHAEIQILHLLKLLNLQLPSAGLSGSDADLLVQMTAQLVTVSILANE